MCGCNLELLAEKGVAISGNDIISDQANREFLAENMIIDKEGWKSGTTRTKLQMLWCVSEDKFKQVFRNYGITIEADNLDELANIIDRRGDEAGELFTDSRQQVFFNVMKELGKIQYTKQEISKAQCKIKML